MEFNDFFFCTSQFHCTLADTIASQDQVNHSMDGALPSLCEYVLVNSTDRELMLYVPMTCLDVI